MDGQRGKHMQALGTGTVSLRKESSKTPKALRAGPEHLSPLIETCCFSTNSNVGFVVGFFFPPLLSKFMIIKLF